MADQLGHKEGVFELLFHAEKRLLFTSPGVLFRGIGVQKVNSSRSDGASDHLDRFAVPQHVRVGKLEMLQLLVPIGIKAVHGHGGIQLVISGALRLEDAVFRCLVILTDLDNVAHLVAHELSLVELPAVFASLILAAELFHNAIVNIVAVRLIVPDGIEGRFIGAHDLYHMKAVAGRLSESALRLVELRVSKGNQLRKVETVQLVGDQVLNGIVLAPVHQPLVQITVNAAVDEVCYNLDRNLLVLNFGVTDVNMSEVIVVATMPELALTVFVYELFCPI